VVGAEDQVAEVFGREGGAFGGDELGAACGDALDAGEGVVDPGGGEPGFELLEREGVGGEDLAEVDGAVEEVGEEATLRVLGQRRSDGVTE
jgi:hypothetical protein